MPLFGAGCPLVSDAWCPAHPLTTCRARSVGRDVRCPARPDPACLRDFRCCHRTGPADLRCHHRTGPTGFECGHHHCGPTDLRYRHRCGPTGFRGGRHLSGLTSHCCRHRSGLMDLGCWWRLLAPGFGCRHLSGLTVLLCRHRTGPTGFCHCRRLLWVDGLRSAASCISRWCCSDWAVERSEMSCSISRRSSSHCILAAKLTLRSPSI